MFKILSRSPSVKQLIGNLPRKSILERPLSMSKMPSSISHHLSTALNLDPESSSSASSPAPVVEGIHVPNGHPVQTKRLRFADVGINLTDATFRGIYHGSRAHEDDLEDVIERGKEVGVLKMMATGSDFEESQRAVEMAESYPGLIYATVGVHPCSAKKFDSHPTGPSSLLSCLESLAQSSKAAGTCTAFGEIGLDYDRLFLTPRETQLRYFDLQLEIATRVQLPLFLHSRAASDDFESLLRKYLDRLPRKGLVHSFTGSVEEMRRLVEMGFDIGINGCSMKTEENVEVVRQIPLPRLQIETDGPWCEMRPSHASATHKNHAPTLPRAVKKEKWEKGAMVKGRCEPVCLVHVAYAVASIKGINVDEVCKAAWRNSVAMFRLGEDVGEREDGEGETPVEELG